MTTTTERRKALSVDPGGPLEAFTPENVSAGALLALGILSLIRGWLWTNRAVIQLIDVYKERLKDKDAEIAELRDTNRIMDARNDMLAEQVRQLVEVGHTTSAVLTALPRGRE